MNYNEYIALECKLENWKYIEQYKFHQGNAKLNKQKNSLTPPNT